MRHTISYSWEEQLSDRHQTCLDQGWQRTGTAREQAFYEQARFELLPSLFQCIHLKKETSETRSHHHPVWGIFKKGFEKDSQNWYLFQRISRILSVWNEVVFYVLWQHQPPWLATFSRGTRASQTFLAPNNCWLHIHGSFLVNEVSTKIYILVLREFFEVCWTST